jgi:hypothetical protein
MERGQNAWRSDVCGDRSRPLGDILAADSLFIEAKQLRIPRRQAEMFETLIEDCRMNLRVPSRIRYLKMLDHSDACDEPRR